MPTVALAGTLDTKGHEYAFLRERLQVLAGRLRHLLPGHVRLNLRVVDAHVDQQHVQALLAQPVPQEVVLVALGVERPCQHDGRHQKVTALNASVCALRACSVGSRSMLEAP